MTTNAQAALQAAATVHAGSKGYTSAQTVTNMAFQFKNWLDGKDRQDAEKAAEESNAVFENTFGLKPTTPYRPAYEESTRSAENAVPKPKPSSIVQHSSIDHVYGNAWCKRNCGPDPRYP